LNPKLKAAVQKLEASVSVSSESPTP